MRAKMFCLVILIGGAQASAQHSPAPRRTMTSRPEGPVSAFQDQSSGQSTASAAALERYRQMWGKMTPAQQKAFLAAGGYTPEQYERMLKQGGSAGGAKAAQGSPDSSAGVDAGALDSLNKSLQNLDAIRDANLSRVQKSSCPPELASRIADLKGKLQSYEFELTGVASAATPPARATEKSGASDAIALAADWFKKHPADQELSAPEAKAAPARETKLLDAALAGTETPAAVPQHAIDPKSPEAERKRKAIEADMAQVKSELAQLSGACAAPKK